MKTPEEKKETHRLACKKYRDKNKTKIDEKRIINKEKRKIYIKEYHVNNPKKRKQYDKKYYEINKEKINKREKTKEQKERICLYNIKYNKRNKEKIKIYRYKNKERFKNNHTKYDKNRRKTDLLYKLSGDIRNMINISFKCKGLKKKHKTEQILGCSINEFKKYLESNFEPWMNWENKGNPKDGVFAPNKTWDVDHKIPLASDKSYDGIIKLNHYTNLQPLCSYYNRFIKRDN